jgi:cytochrome subunit of sulfide dehydrogenase
MRVRAVVALAAMLGIVAAAPPPPGASSCSGCHGGMAPVPVLTGRDAGEIVVALDAFRAGTKPATVMDRIAKGFSHDESVAIAVWLAGPK